MLNGKDKQVGNTHVYCFCDCMVVQLKMFNNVRGAERSMRFCKTERSFENFRNFKNVDRNQIPTSR